MGERSLKELLTAIIGSQSVERAAQAAGISRATMYRVLNANPMRMPEEELIHTLISISEDPTITFEELQSAFQKIVSVKRQNKLMKSKGERAVLMTELILLRSKMEHNLPLVKDEESYSTRYDLHWRVDKKTKYDRVCVDVKYDYKGKEVETIQNTIGHVTWPNKGELKGWVYVAFVCSDGTQYPDEDLITQLEEKENSIKEPISVLIINEEQQGIYKEICMGPEEDCPVRFI